MRKIFVSLLAVCFVALGITTTAFANSEGIAWDKAPGKVTDLASLRNGAKVFVNYCLNCHSASYMRFNRLKDIGLTDQQIKDNLLFTTDKVGETMKASFDPRQAKEWFGGTPPDLSVIARSRSAEGKGTGADYLYTYLRTFYVDDSKATGWNNLAFPNIAMPHALWELQGKRAAIFESREEHGVEVHVFKGWEQLTPGSMSPAEYDQTVADLVNYLQWMAEPAQNTRVHLGYAVLAFLLVLIFCAWRLNAAYWRDVK